MTAVDDSHYDRDDYDYFICTHHHNYNIIIITAMLSS